MTHTKKPSADIHLKDIIPEQGNIHDGAVHKNFTHTPFVDNLIKRLFTDTPDSAPVAHTISNPLPYPIITPNITPKQKTKNKTQNEISDVQCVFDTPQNIFADTLSDAHYNHGHRTRLKQRFMTHGYTALQNYEILELILFQAIPRRDVKILAKKLLEKFGDISAVLMAPPEILRTIDGVGEHIIYIFKLFSGASEFILSQNVTKKTVLSTWSHVCDYARLKLGHLGHEEFHVWFLNKTHHLLHEHLLSKGTIDKTVVYPRQLVKLALDYSASGVILLHNHPSGDTTPSGADIAMTNKIKDTLEHLDITIIDHVIVGRDEITSFRILGLL